MPMHAHKLTGLLAVLVLLAQYPPAPLPLPLPLQVLPEWLFAGYTRNVFVSYRLASSADAALDASLSGKVGPAVQHALPPCLHVKLEDPMSACMHACKRRGPLPLPRASRRSSTSSTSRLF